MSRASLTSGSRTRRWSGTHSVTNDVLLANGTGARPSLSGFISDDSVAGSHDGDDVAKDDANVLLLGRGRPGLPRAAAQQVKDRRRRTSRCPSSWSMMPAIPAPSPTSPSLPSSHQDFDALEAEMDFESNPVPSYL